MEIEMKYLVKKIDFNIHSYKNNQIIQGYISLDPEIRIRNIGDKYFVTEKSTGDLIRKEKEYQITKRDFLNKSKQIISNLIKKRRYYIPILDGFIAELDIYELELDGLITVEVEFNDLKLVNNFMAPEWFGKSITYDKKYKNKNLSKLNKEKIKNGKVID